MSVEYQNSILWRGEDPLKRKHGPGRDASKQTTRYFPGKAPKWARGDEDKDEERESTKDKHGFSDVRQSDKSKRKKAAPVILEDPAANKGAANSRLARLQQAQKTDGTTQKERLDRHRRVHEVAQILEEERADGATDAFEIAGKRWVKDGGENWVLKEADKEDISAKGKGLKKEESDDDMEGKLLLGEVKDEADDDEDSEDEELRSLRRDKAREVALLKRKEEETLLQDQLCEEDEEADEDDSEEESDSEDDPRRMLKPVFVRKAQRDTVIEKENEKKKEEEAAQKEEEKKAASKVETKELLVETIRRDEEADAQIETNDGSDIELIDDDDEKNEAEEYELWKIRELKRIKRDKTERMVRQKEIDFILKRRAMTEEERMIDDKKLDDDANLRDEAKGFNFLQKYYHRGGFFQDKAREGEEPLYLRDYHEPTEEEKFDKKLLPAAMQLRRGQFGKKGQVKHTHLTEVDTTDMSAAWSKHTKQIERYQERMATASGVNNFDRPGAVKR